MSTDSTPTYAVVERQYEDPVTGHTVKGWHSNPLPLWSLYCGQAAEALRLVDEASVDCVVTSPPYFWLRDYQVEGQIGQEDSVEGYISALTTVMEGVFRVLKPSGTLFLNMGDTYYSGKGKSHGVDKKSSKRRFGLRAVDKSGGLGIGLKRKSVIAYHGEWRSKCVGKNGFCGLLSYGTGHSHSPRMSRTVQLGATNSSFYSLRTATTSLISQSSQVIAGLKMFGVFLPVPDKTGSKRPLLSRMDSLSNALPWVVRREA